MEEECDEDLDSDGDVELGWVEFAMEVNGIEMLKDVNVEDVVDRELESNIMEAFDDVTGLELNVAKLKDARKEEIGY